MALFSLLYASRSVIPAGGSEAAAEAIVEVSRPRNQNADVTGCLIFAAGRFAQVLEGEQTAVEVIMASIHRDQRHTEVSILKQGLVAERRFTGWALDYMGPSQFVQRTIAKPLPQTLRGSLRGIEDLLRLMTAFRSA